MTGKAADMIGLVAYFINMVWGLVAGYYGANYISAYFGGLGWVLWILAFVAVSTVASMVGWMVFSLTLCLIPSMRE